MSDVTYPTAAIRKIRSALRKTGSTIVSMSVDADNVVTFDGQDTDGKTRVAGTVDGSAISFTTKPKIAAKPKAAAPTE